MIIVSNSTPLIAFSRIGQMDLLRSITGRLYIPQEVANEISEYGKNKNKSINLKDYNWIQIKKVKEGDKTDFLLPSLDKGEAEVILLALEMRAPMVLIDELSGRKVAEYFGLNIIGSAGILLKAKATHQINAVKPYLDDMISKGIRYSERFYKSFLNEIGEL
ncbi:MAG: DUF3368 domain-containing protein [bacterium]